MAGGRRKSKKLKYSRLEENWGEQGGNLTTARVETNLEVEMSQLVDTDHPDPNRMYRKRKVPPVLLRTSSITDYYKVMRTIEEEPCDQNVMSQDQVEKLAPTDDQVEEYNPENKEDDQEHVIRKEDRNQEDHDDRFGSQVDQNDFADHELSIRDWIDQEAEVYLRKKAGGVPRTQPDRYYEFPDYDDQEDPFGTESDQEKFDDQSMSLNAWIDQAAEEYQKDQQRKSSKASSALEIPQTQRSGVEQVLYLNEDDSKSSEEDDLIMNKDDLERQFILESSWFEETPPLTSNDHHDDPYRLPDWNQGAIIHQSTIPDQIGDKMEIPDIRDASTVSIGGDSLAVIGTRPTELQTVGGKSNIVIKEDPFENQGENAFPKSDGICPARMTPLRHGGNILDDEDEFHRSLLGEKTSTPVPSSGKNTKDKLSHLSNMKISPCHSMHG